MAISSVASPAAPPEERVAASADAVSRDIGERPGVFGRALVALLWALAGQLLGRLLAQLPVLSLLGLSSVTFVTAGALFGWVGVAMASLVRLAHLATVNGISSLATTYPWVSTAGYAAAAALVWLVLRRIPGLGRRFPDSRTVTWFGLASCLGAILSSTVITLFGDHVESLFDEVTLWARSTLASVWVFAPALIIVGERWLRPFLAPIPGEADPAAPRRVRLVSAAVPGQRVHVVDVETRELSIEHALGRGLLAVALITAGKLALAGTQGHGYAWWNLLFMFPIWWLAKGWRMTGALLGAGLVGAAALGSDAVLAGATPLPHSIALAVYAQMLGYLFVAVVLGGSAEREGRLLEGLTELHERLEQDLQRVVKALTGAAAAKDEYTEGHLQRVNAYALEVGRRLGLDSRQVELLQIASTLHDIGKIGIPETILNKRGPLAVAEREVMQRHPEIGARLLARIDGLRDAAPLVLHHQERWDGRRDGEFPGYPAGLSGEAIPLGARVIAVVDAFDAMTTDRPYRKALPGERAREVLREERGRQFDPLVVDVFLTVLDERPWQ
jgi:hypothetical protein